MNPTESGQKLAGCPMFDKRLSASNMGSLPRRFTLCFILSLSIFLANPAYSQSPDPTPEKPLPDINTLMRHVESNERKVETLQQNYLYDESTALDLRDSRDGTKKTETRDLEVFWLNGVPVRRTLKQNGKPLTPDELKKEDDRIDAIVKKAKERRAKADAQGKETDPHGHDELTFSRILELGAFSNPRRQPVNGRDTILIDYQGDPKAKTHNPGEGAFKELAGTLWVDEQDQTLQHLEGHFDHDFKVAGGLAVSVKQGTWFKATFVKVNDEVWLPASFEGDGHARYLLFFSLNGHFKASTRNYRRFKATSTILPGATKIDPDAPPDDPIPSPAQPPR
jgi:hypothetical protein